MTSPDLIALAALAERVEQLSGPDISADAEIFRLSGRMPADAEIIGAMYSFDAKDDGRVVAFLPRFTESLDAAMSLTADCEYRSFGQGSGPAWASVGVRGVEYVAEAATPALALVSASLRALSQVDRSLTQTPTYNHEDR